MADVEVENTLREIRERVRAEALAEKTPVRRSVEVRVSQDDGAPDEARAIAEARARIEANLAVVERTWNKLPPLTSYRHGWTARLELWLKRQIKRATHWYTWEQVNFNAAVHSTLRDTLSALDALDASHKEQLARVRTEEAAAAEARLTAMMETISARLSSEFASQLSEALTRALTLTSNIASTMTTNMGNAHAQLSASVEAVREEQRERVAHAEEEQRVCFKQLSLEATEMAVAADRARRATEQRLDELRKRVEEIAQTVTGDK